MPGAQTPRRKRRGIMGAGSANPDYFLPRRPLGAFFSVGNSSACAVPSPGTGKTHTAIAIGVLAVRRGHRVFWSSAKRLGTMILEAKMRNTLNELYRKLLQARLWIIDDWGIVSLRREVAEEVFDLIDRRKYSSAMILTSNRDIEEWPQVFPDTVLANSTIDRLFEDAKICLFKGMSYRLKGRISAKDVDPEKTNG